LGSNGHIGFNEPTSSLSSYTRIKTLAQRTMRDNARFFGPGEFQPFNALTMGIGSIMEARRILMLATGKRKAEAVAAMIEGPLTSMHPASVLQMHDNAVAIVDEEAAEQLQMRDYYDWVLTMQDKIADRYGDLR
jgi:glucosamine-6-phosphate deaminase